MSENINGYKLHKIWFDFVLDNPGKMNASHTSLYLALVELNNNLNWRISFSITSTQCMAMMPCSSRSTYTKCLHDLIEWGFVKIVQKSSNQYSSNVISLYNNCTSTSLASGQPPVQAQVQHVDYSKTNKTIKTSKTNKDVNNIEFNKNDFRKCLLEKGVNPQHLDDWFKVRIAKKAPFTKTALNGFLNECKINNFPVSDAVKICAEENWTGFKYQWIINKNNSRSVSKTNLTSKLKNEYDW